MSFAPNFAHPGTYRVLLFPLCDMLLVLVAGCGNSCFIGVVNPPNNSLIVSTGNPPPACPLPQPKTAVKAVAHLAQACTGCSTSRQVTHVHLLLSGMEVHPSAVADENSPDWEELAPDWARQPQWVDLLEDHGSNDAVLPLNVTGQIPIGTYSQLRLHLAKPSPQHAEQFAAESHCSSIEASCVGTADGNFHLLQTLDGHPYLRVTATSPLDLRADQPNQLRIELRPEWVLQNPSAGVLDLVPVLHGQVVVEPTAATGSF